MRSSNLWGRGSRFIFTVAILIIAAFLFSSSASKLYAETVDDFDGNSVIAAWWTSDTQAPYVYTLDFANIEHVHSGAKALKVTYDKRNDSNAYSWLAAKGGYNLKNFDYLSFWVYNDGSPLKFRIRLEDTATGVWESNWANIEPQTETSQADWENLVVDLTRTFPSAINMTSIGQIIFMIQPGDGASFGTFWIDDVQLSRGPNPAPLDTFESDFYGWAAGAPFSLALNSAEFYNGGGASDLGTHSLKISWTAKSADYSNFTYEPTHDSANAPLNRIGNFPNFKLNNNTLLELWVKSTTDNNIPILLKFGSEDISTQYYFGNGNWQKLSWNYSAAVSATQVDKAYFIVYPGLADDGGTLFVDGLNLTGGSPILVPTAPTGFSSDATNPDGDGSYTISWNSVSGTTGYHIQEAQNQDFNGAADYYSTDIFLNITKNPQTQAGTYYYRVRSKILENGADNYSSFTKPISVTVVATPSGAKNNSYITACAEVDNVNVPIYKKDISAYRITATHPEYADDVAATPIWTIGIDDGAMNEFKQTNFNNADEYYPQDNPSSGIDEPSTELPAEINNDWMNYQYLKFTTDSGSETILGAQFTIDFAGVNGTLEIKVSTWGGTAWVNQGSKIFNAGAKQQTWNLPDGTFVTGTDANNIFIEVIPAAQGGQSTPGAWAQYDQIKLVRNAILNNRGADWSGCQLGEAIWSIGVDDGVMNEFKQTAFNNNDEYYPQDNPSSGIDELVGECPKEINNDWMNDQYLKFTTEPGYETNLGGSFTIDFAGVNGTLEIKVWTWGGSGWVDRGSKIFTPSNKKQTWELPDGAWVLGADGNNLHLDVVTASEGGQSTPGAWAQYDQMTLTRRSLSSNEIFLIGADNNSVSEFKPAGFSNFDEYYPQDNPSSGIDEPSTELPAEINNDWMNYQYLKFTTDSGSETILGAQFTIDFAGVNGTLEIKVSTWGGTGWVNQGSKIFNAGAKQQTWNLPDGTFVTGTDANNIFIEVIPAAQGGQSTPGAWAQYDQIKLVGRNLASDTIVDLYHQASDVDVAGAIMDGWWLSPETMTIRVIGGDTLTGAHYLQLYKKVPGTQNEYQQCFVLYEDGNARIIPLPKEGEDWIPFGASVIIGPAPEAERPFVDIDEVVIDPNDLSMNITYGDGSTAHLEFFADRTQTIIDVSSITYNTTDRPFATLRSMWVKDGNSDIDSIRTQDGRFPILGDWNMLDGNWWFFSKIVPSYHNTLAPDIKIESVEPSEGFLTVQAEALNSGSGYEIIDVANAFGGKVISMSSAGGEAIYNINLSENRPNSYLALRYSDTTGGNAINVYLDDVLKAQLNTTSTGGMSSFELLPYVYFGNPIVGNHQVKIITSAGTDGVYLDQLEFISYEIPRSVATPIITRQAETADFGSGYEIVYRSNAVGGQTVIMSANGAEVYYNISLTQDYQNCYMRIRYSDEVAPNSVGLYVDGVFQGKFPSFGTGGWDSFLISPDIYLGNLTSGTHQIKIQTDSGTYGMDLDQFELVFYAPFKCVVKYINPYYYDSNGIPVWYIGTTMHYELHIKNLSEQQISNLDVKTIQEYHEAGPGYDKGTPLPGDSLNEWLNKTIPLKSTLVLDDDYYYIPPEAQPGYEQTHLIISKSGFELYNDPEAGIWCPPSVEGSISGTINMEGRSDHSAEILFELRNPQDGSLISINQATSNSSGDYKIESIKPGTYNVVAKTLNSLKAKQSNIIVVTRSETKGVNFNLTAGDADGDNKINYADRNIQKEAYGSTKGSLNWDGRADFNGDGKIDYVDRNLLKKNYGKIGN